MIKVGLPKGNMLSNSLNIVNNILKSNIDLNTRKLFFKDDNIEFYLLKHRDIPSLIDNHIIDIGITSEEWVIEKQLKNKLKIIKYLDWCDTRISLINKKGNVINKNTAIKCITEFPFIAQSFFETKKIEHYIYYVSGSSEALIGNDFECCIDCVESGKTLEANELYEEEVILKSKMVLLTKENTLKLDKYSDIIIKAIST